jgi:purine-nucleoside phosphorylase
MEKPETPHARAILAAEVIREKTGVQQFDIAITLGSGWSGAASLLGSTIARISAEEVPGFGLSGVPGHTGEIAAIEEISGTSVLVLGSRTHLYEGKGVEAVAHPVRTAAACGARIMVLTNGAGAIRENWVPGQPVLISDHINLTARSPLVGNSFVDLTDLYSRRLRDIARRVDESLEEGVYVQFRGPHYETPAEIVMAKSMGGSMVGMSTALEAIAAREAGMEVLGLSLITNLAAGVSKSPLSHQEVLESGKSAAPVIGKLLAQIVEAL